MLGKTPALAAMAALFTMLTGGTQCMAQSGGAAAQSAPSAAQETGAARDFDTWRDRFRARALKAGVPHDIFEKALGNVRPNPEVHERDADQPEFNRPIWEYLDGAVSETRVRNGRKMLRQHASLLAKAERTYGIPRRILVAIWGMETSYGALLGSHNIFQALATLSYRGERTDYGEEQLLAALRLLADGDKPAEAMKGSWAGAVGHTQFIPTTYLKYAVDGDSDGRRDLWDSLSDVFDSTAHYLKKSGYNPDLKWGREAFLPDGFDYALAGYEVTKTLSEWRELGVRMANGALVPDLDIAASVLVPAGHQGPAFLVYESYHAILAYNRSTSYALAIGLLSDEINGGPSLKKSWPRHLKPLHIDERIEIQRRLTELGYTPGKADGVLGRETRKAIREFQKDHGDIADGFATAALLTKLRAASPAETASTEQTPEKPAASESGIATESAPPPDEPSVVASADSPAETDGQADSPEAAEEIAVQDSGMAAAAEAETPRPRAKPANVSEESPARPRAKPLAVAAVGDAAPAASAEDAGQPTPGLPDEQTPPQSGSAYSGVTSALAAPGLVILGNGVAAPRADPGQPATGPEEAAAVPLNNGAEEIVSPPGITYVGAVDEAEEAEAKTAGETAEDPSDEADAGEDDVSGRDKPDPEPGS